MSHRGEVGGGGIRKGPKKCHVLFEWPLISNKKTYTVFVINFNYNPLGRNIVQSNSIITL